MEKVKSVLERRLEVVRRRKEAVLREEARLIRLARQKRDVAMVLAKVKKEKLALMAEEASPQGAQAERSRSLISNFSVPY